MDPLGQALGLVPAQTFGGRGSWHWLCPGCQGGERGLWSGLCASCKNFVPAIVSQSERDLDLMAPWSFPEQAGQGVPAPPLWQPCLLKLTSRPPRLQGEAENRAEGGAGGGQSWENRPPQVLLHWGGWWWYSAQPGTHLPASWTGKADC